MRIEPLIIAGFCIACSSSSGGEDPTDPGSDSLLEPPTRGVQLSMVTSVQSGAEVEHCQFVQMGNEDLWVQRDEIRFTEGSHHVLLYSTPYTELPTETRAGEPFDPAGVFDCSIGVQELFDATSFLAGSQNARGDALLKFPENTAIKVEAGAVLLINAHYINTTPEVLEPEVRINLHTIPEDEVETEGGIFFFYNPFIRVRARSLGSANMECGIDENIWLSSMQSHMHARGTTFQARMFEAGGGERMLYENMGWEDIPVTHHDPGVAVEAGSSIRIDCGYDNSEDHDVYQGFKTTDEMCVFAGSYYPRTPGVGTCFTSGKWEGQGSVGCQESLTCLQGAFGQDDLFAAMSNCIADSSPEVSEPLSDAIGCTAGQFFGNTPEGCPAKLARCAEL